MRRLWIVPCLAAFLVATPSFAEDADSDYPLAVAVFVTKAEHKDCAAIEKNFLAAVRKKYAEKNVLFVSADVSTAASRKQAQLLLTALQAGGVWTKHAKSPGRVVLLDADMDESAVLDAKTTEADASKKLDALLKPPADEEEMDDDDDG